MKIGIHKVSGSFSDRWIDYCELNNIEYKIVNAYKSDIVYQLSDCDAFMWNIVQSNFKDMLYGKQLMYSLQRNGKVVFPNFNTCWHFDDKVGQKYLLESVGAPFVKTDVFYSLEESLKWIKQEAFPKVFKLSGGAGSYNVYLAQSKRMAIRFSKKAFGRGFQPISRFKNLNEHIRKIKEGKESFLVGMSKGIIRLFFQWDYLKMFSRVKGYAYFQEFLPNNNFDIRVIVTGDKAFAIKRMTRKNDFRASGSGNIIYNELEIDIRCIEIAFNVNKSLETQSIAYDFIFDKINNPLIVEISYNYAVNAYDKCTGYWDNELNWHEESFKPQYWHVENLIDEILKSKK